MDSFGSGKFIGDYKRTLALGPLLLNEAVYTHGFVDWHYHENAYFTFLLQGHLLEANKKERYHCTPGTLLFHSWQEAHYNVKYPQPARGFHLEVRKEWFAQHELSPLLFEGSYEVACPLTKAAFTRIYTESGIADDATPVSVEALLLALFSRMAGWRHRKETTIPRWVGRLEEMLREEETNKISLASLSRDTGRHPVYLSSEFPRYFGCTIGEYLRKLKVERTVPMLLKGEDSLAQIAYGCGFADQSHFIRSFKAAHGVAPLRFRKLARR